MIRTKKPCNECPFRREAPAGWLGPWTVEGILSQIMSEAGLMCHSTVVNTGVIAPGTQVCSGSLDCANKSSKLYRDPELAQLAAEIREDEKYDCMDAVEFKEHHS